MAKETLKGSFQNPSKYLYRDHEITVSTYQDPDGSWSGSFSADNLKGEIMQTRGIFGIAVGYFSSASDAVEGAKAQCEDWIDRIRGQTVANIEKKAW